MFLQDKKSYDKDLCDINYNLDFPYKGQGYFLMNKRNVWNVGFSC